MRPAEPDGRRIRRLARATFGFEHLRPGQEEAIRSVAAGRDTLAVLPTGWGKSAIYQLAALLIPGPTVVVSPLIALQRDQLRALLDSDVDAAAANSQQSPGGREETLSRFAAGDLELLFLAPEQLANDHVLESAAAAQPSLFVVDEAHCISAWGHDFRPDYLRLADAARALGRPPILALTATAAPPVRAEIVERLGLRNPTVVVRGFDRPNIRLCVERFTDGDVKRATLVEKAARERGPGLVYVATRRSAEEVADVLAAAGVEARAYHAGLPANRRAETEAAFADGRCQVVVATTAFGMGIDKPDVRFVYHHDVADSLDSYYQEIGRAGRDGPPANAILFYRPEDLSLRRFFASGATVTSEQAREVARARAGPEGEAVDTEGLGEATGLAAGAVHRVAQAVEERRSAAAAGGDVPSPETVADQVAADSEAHRRVEQSRVEMMRAYAESRGCRRRVLLGYFGEELDRPCGNCDRCVAGATEAAVGAESPFAPGTRVAHREWGGGEVMSHQDGRVTVFFDDVGYKTLDLALVADNDLLQSEA